MKRLDCLDGLRGVLAVYVMLGHMAPFSALPGWMTGPLSHGGAAVDVMTPEPLPKGHPLWRTRNLLITPHTAALTGKLWERHYALFSENLRRYRNDEPMLAVVDNKPVPHPVTKPYGCSIKYPGSEG